MASTLKEPIFSQFLSADRKIFILCHIPSILAKLADATFLLKGPWVKGIVKTSVSEESEFSQGYLVTLGHLLSHFGLTAFSSQPKRVYTITNKGVLIEKLTYPNFNSGARALAGQRSSIAKEIW